MKVLVVGSYNVGLTVLGSRIPRPGETVMGHAFDMGPGGKGSNQAIGLARLGGDVSFVGRLGNDVFGRDALDLFAQEGIDTQFVAVDDDAHTGAGIISVDEKGQNAIHVAPGANYRLSVDDLDRAAALFETAAFLLVQLETPVAVVAEAVRRAKQAGMTVILNPAPAQKLDAELLAMIDILTPNEAEAETLSGIPVSDPASAERAGQYLRSQGAGTVILTLGEAGALLIDEQSSRPFDAYRVDAVDTTGAGDAFNAGLTYALAAGMALDDAVDFAAKTGALCVTRVGVVPGLPRLADIENYAWRRSATGDG